MHYGVQPGPDGETANVDLVQRPSSPVTFARLKSSDDELHESGTAGESTETETEGASVIRSGSGESGDRDGSSSNDSDSLFSDPFAPRPPSPQQAPKLKPPPIVDQFSLHPYSSPVQLPGSARLSYLTISPLVAPNSLLEIHRKGGYVGFERGRGKDGDGAYVSPYFEGKLDVFESPSSSGYGADTFDEIISNAEEYWKERYIVIRRGRFQIFSSLASFQYPAYAFNSTSADPASNGPMFNLSLRTLEDISDGSDLRYAADIGAASGGNAARNVTGGITSGMGGENLIVLRFRVPGTNTPGQIQLILRATKLAEGPDIDVDLSTVALGTARGKPTCSAPSITLIWYLKCYHI